MIRQLLTNAALDFVDEKTKKGRIPSDWDIGDYLDHWLEHYEREHGDVIEADDFEALCDELGQQFVNNGKVYKRGDWDSYFSLVRSKNLVSVQEHTMNKNIKANKNRRIIFRDTEFPVDENGYYVFN